MHDISDIARLSIGDARDWFAGLESDKLKGQESEKSQPASSKRSTNGLASLVNVGLNFCQWRATPALSPAGESQRIRLASQIGSGLTGVLYVLDEPSIGLHQRDNDRLLATLVRLRDLGNTVLVVEHDEDPIRLADYVIDMGPGAGVHGGQGRRRRHAGSDHLQQRVLDRPHLSGALEISVPKSRRKAKKGRFVRVENASGNNLRDVTVDFPLGVLTCVTGVSGGGKSTLVLETLWKGLRGAFIRRVRCRHRTRPSMDPNFSTRLSISTSPQSGARRGRTRHLHWRIHPDP